MSKGKQIEEIANIIFAFTPLDTMRYEVENAASALYHAGYRKQSEVIPCKIGDTVWAIRNYGGGKVIRSGKVSEMYFVGEYMKLCIVVKGITRGEWGKEIFGSYEEAQKAMVMRGE